LQSTDEVIVGEAKRDRLTTLASIAAIATYMR
jgi:hypothetical protein